MRLSVHAARYPFGGIRHHAGDGKRLRALVERHARSYRQPCGHVAFGVAGYGSHFVVKVYGIGVRPVTDDGNRETLVEDGVPLAVHLYVHEAVLQCRDAVYRDDSALDRCRAPLRAERDLVDARVHRVRVKQFGRAFESLYVCLYAFLRSDDVLVAGYHVPFTRNDVQRLQQRYDVAFIVHLHHTLVGRQRNAVRVLPLQRLFRLGGELDVHAGKVAVLLKRAVAVHHHAADGQPLEQPVLHADVLRRVYHPRVHILQAARIIACLVGNGLACLVGEVAVGEEVHALHRMD